MKLEIIKAEEFGLDALKVAPIEQAFAPAIIERNALIESYEALILGELTPKLAVEAKTLRLKLVKVRTSIASIHKTQKEYSLSMGRFIDAWKNKETEPVSQMEAKLSEIETYFEKLEAEKLAKLKAERIEKLSTVCDNASIFSVELMTDEAFDSLFEGQKLAKEAKIKAIEEARLLADKEAEQRRLDEIENQKRIEAQRVENEKLKLEAEKKEAALLEERRANEKKEADIKAENERKQKELNDKLEAERKANELKEAKVKAENEAKLKAEKDAKDKLQKELNDKLEAERLELESKKALELEALKQAEILAKAPLKDKLAVWINEANLTAPIGAESEAKVIDILAKFSAFKVWANNEIAKI